MQLQLVDDPLPTTWVVDPYPPHVAGRCSLLRVYVFVDSSESTQPSADIFIRLVVCVPQRSEMECEGLTIYSHFNRYDKYYIRNLPCGYYTSSPPPPPPPLSLSLSLSLSLRSFVMTSSMSLRIYRLLLEIDGRDFPV